MYLRLSESSKLLLQPTRRPPKSSEKLLKRPCRRQHQQNLCLVLMAYFLLSFYFVVLMLSLLSLFRQVPNQYEEAAIKILGNSLAATKEVQSLLSSFFSLSFFPFFFFF
jgi:hypothetical protein